jgi:hypothetical protein
VARAIFGNIFGFQALCLEYGGPWLHLEQRWGPFAKPAWIYRFGIIFEWIKRMDSVHGSWTIGSADLWWTEGRPWRGAHWSSCSRPTPATGVTCEVGKRQGGIRGSVLLLTQGREATRRRHTSGGASAPSGDGVSLTKNGRR